MSTMTPDQPLSLRPPAQLAGRLYVGNASDDGAWTLRVLTDTGSDTLLEASTHRDLAEAMLRDAFPGHLIRADLIDALAHEAAPRPHPPPPMGAAGRRLRPPGRPRRRLVTPLGPRPNLKQPKGDSPL